MLCFVQIFPFSHVLVVFTGVPTDVVQAPSLLWGRWDSKGLVELGAWMGFRIVELVSGLGWRLEMVLVCSVSGIGVKHRQCDRVYGGVVG